MGIEKDFDVFVSDFESWANSEVYGSHRGTIRFVYRKNISFKDKEKETAGAFIGLIRDDQESSGRYNGLSLVLFPPNPYALSEKDKKNWLIALAVGSDGYGDDIKLAMQPGVRRLFSRIASSDTYLKSDFSDIESSTGFMSWLEGQEVSEYLKKSLKKYSNVILSGELVNPDNKQQYKDIILKYLAAYAYIRGWSGDGGSQLKIDDILNRIIVNDKVDYTTEIKDLLKKRQYIVLQGAPGTGKTRIAKRISSEMVSNGGEVFFTQFHAETSYSDFVNGIRPDVEKDSLVYRNEDGILVKAINKAIKLESSGQPVILIIDEINRANLSNVLGPIFYLFEYKMDVVPSIGIKVPGIEEKLSKLPNNFYVIATMNTADRSLAVIDFALRRRFAWYTMKPHIIEDRPFMVEDFRQIDEIFEKFASDEELNLQPGQGYFIADSREEFEDRLRYELLPLIKEYLKEGFLKDAEDAFEQYFWKTIKERIFV